MENKYKVSVIVPIYNVAEYLQECLDSLVRQTIDQLEVIMVDDGSTDMSGTIAKSYEDKYENFFYYLKENGGLGNARNYGIQFVHGDYIIFLDSDDIVPDDAYEAMYNKAIETGNDMVVGDVQRFDSRHIFNSGLHRKAFRDAYDFTTILETPELIYDTTSWNKLIKFSFWKEHDFKFPEKILYEDIPVTMPLHFYANAVSVINKIVYLWRTRDGANKSITQNRTEMKNFDDRVKIMKMVDRFYKENVKDDHSLYMKDYKWMAVDLKLYIQEMLTADDEFINYAMETIRNYIKEFRKDSFDALPAIDRMKYYLISKNKKKRLLELLQYEKTTYNILKIKKKKVDGKVKYIGCFPFNDFPDEYYDMTSELNLYPETRELQDVHWEGSTLYLKGYSFIKRLSCGKRNAQDITASLLNVQTKERIEIPLEVCKANGVRGKHGLRVDRANRKMRYFNYKWSGFQGKIDFSSNDVLKIANGLLKIEIHYRRDGIDKKYYMGGPIAGSVVRPQHLNVEGVKVRPYYNLGYDLCIDCEPQVALVEQLNVENGLLRIKTLQPMDTPLSFCCKGKKSNIDIKKIDDAQPFHYKGAGAIIRCEGTINIQDMEIGNTYQICMSNEKALSTNDLFISKYFLVHDRMFRAAYNELGEIILECKKSGTIVSSMIKKDHKITITTKTSFEMLKTDNLSEAEIFLQGEKMRSISKSIKASVDKLDGEVYKCQFDIDLDDETFTKALIADRWFFNIRYHTQTGMIEHTLLGDCVDKLDMFAVQDYNYAFYPSNENELLIKVSRKWKWYESNKLRRKAIEKIAYPLLRLLPIRKKTMVFEGWWGQKYHCNPKAFYEYMDHEHPEYKCIWSMVDERTPINGNGKTVRRKSLKYHYYMATSKYFINNVNFMDSYEKRKKQIEIQTMHGTPLKTLGLDVPGELPTQKDVDKFLRKCNRWNYLVVQSQKAEQITSSCYAFKKEFLRTGYPRNDILFEKNNSRDIAEIKRKLGIPVDKKVVMYAPTWRVRNQFNLNMDIQDLKSRLKDDYVMMLRIHPFSVNGLDENLLDDFIFNASNYPSVEELYLISDIVITDYSSVMFDYAILNRPMLFYTYDLEDYRDTLRGFNFDFVAEAPGPLLKSSKEVVDAIVDIDRVSKENDQALQKFRKKFCEYEKGNACEQIYNIVIKQ